MIRIIHTLGGCGGTLLSRCIGVLPGVALLSELNPNAVKLFPAFDPLYQDRTWLRLLGEARADHFSKKDLGRVENFRELVEAFHDCALAASRRLVIRDYNYIDFVGVPFIEDPPRRPTLYTALPNSVPTASIVFVRHPIDQWLSLCKHAPVRDVLKPAAFCEAYAAFLRTLGPGKIYKYEDFVRNPDTELWAICNDLSIPFQASFIEKFHHFDCVTGDMTRLRDETISVPARKALLPALLEEFRSSQNFEYILQATGYAGTIVSCRSMAAG